MDLELTDEQKLLRESVESLLSRASEEDVWARLVEFGGLEVGPEGLGAVELCLIARALGEHLATVPYIGTASLRYAASLSDEGGAAVAAALGEGGRASVALFEPGQGWGLETLRTRFEGGALSGAKAAVESPAGAEAAAVLARADGGTAIALLDPGAEGVKVTPERAIDPRVELVRLDLDGAACADGRRLDGEAGAQAAERLLAVGGLLAAAEAVGAAAKVLGEAAEYAGQRRQFGRTIGSNQALRHLLADLVVRESSAWSSVLYAAAELDESGASAAQTASIAKAWASRATLEVAHGAMQVFGGIAFTEEHPAHLYLRRISLRGQQFGDADHHERALGRALAAR